MRPSHSRDDGIALVAVLWAVAALSLIAAVILASTSLTYKIGRNTWSRTQVSAAADAAISRAILGMLDARSEARWRVDGTPQQFEFEGAQISVRIEDESGKVDFNEADGALLRRLLIAAGAGEDSASSIVDAILNWRQRDAFESAQGMAGATASRAAVAPSGTSSPFAHRPRKGPFQSLDELKLVPGLTAELFDALKGSITVYSGRSTIDTATAPKLALMAYQGINAEQADKLVAERTIVAGPAGAVAGGKLNPSLPITGRTFAIISTAERGSIAVERRTVILLTGDPTRPYLVLDWR